jgi:hypothetical protein
MNHISHFPSYQQQHQPANDEDDGLAMTNPNYIIPESLNQQRSHHDYHHGHHHQNGSLRIQQASSTTLDQLKLDKKRERNRIAATKCRQRKLEKIQTLGNNLGTTSPSGM